MKRFTSLLRRFFTKPEYVFLVPALVFGTLSALLMPQLIVNDENMHFIRSYELSELEFGHDCTIPADIKERGFFAIYAYEQPDYSFNTKSIDMDDQIATDCGTATPYNPLLHLPQAIGVAFAKLVWPSTGAMILFARLANVLFYALMLFLIIRKAKLGKWILVIIGLLPMMIHMAGSMSGDVVNNIVLLGFITFIFNLFVQKHAMSRKQILVLLGLSALLATTKLPYLVLLLSVFLLPRKVLPEISIRKKRMPKNLIRLGLAALCGVFTLGVVLLWSYIYGGEVVSSTNVNNPVTEEPYKFLGILYNTYVNPSLMFDGVSYSDWLMRGVVGSFASFSYHLPYSLVVVLSCLFVVIAFRKDVREEELVKPVLKPLSIIMLVSLSIMILAITYGLYTAWAIQPFGLGETASFALGLQGRYFTPLILMLVPLAIVLRKYINVNFRQGSAVGALIFAVMVFILSYYLLQTLAHTQSLMA